MDMLHDGAVAPVMSAVNHLGREAHLYLGFVRFTENAGVLASVIEPKNRVLPLIAQHFLDRYRNEAFILFDRTHREALVAQNGRGRVMPLESLELPEPDDLERAVRALWRRFHQAVGIDPRRNSTCQRTHLPLRYRSVMTEFQADPVGHESPRDPLPEPALPGASTRLPGAWKPV
jgi:probable DNA metabolism protein